MISGILSSGSTMRACTALHLGSLSASSGFKCERVDRRHAIARPGRTSARDARRQMAPSLIERPSQPNRAPPSATVATRGRRFALHSAKTPSVAFTSSDDAILDWCVLAVDTDPVHVRTSDAPPSSPIRPHPSRYSHLQNGSDVRGVAMTGIEGQSVTLTPGAAYFIAQAFTEWVAAKLGKSADSVRISVGKDSRLSGPQLLEAVAAGIIHAGGSVFDTGLSTTPSMFMSCITEQAGDVKFEYARHNSLSMCTSPSTSSCWDWSFPTRSPEGDADCPTPYTPSLPPPAPGPPRLQL